MMTRPATRRPTKRGGDDVSKAIPVLVTSGDERSTLAVARSVGAAGFPCHVVSVAANSPAGSSRFVSSQHKVTDPVADPAAFASETAELARKLGVRIVLPMTDPAMTAILAHDQLFEGMHVPFPAMARYAAISDKDQVVAAARRHGISVPITRRVHTPEELTAPSSQGLPFPVVVKPARSVVLQGSRLVRTTVRYASTPEELSLLGRELPREAFPVLLQERVGGVGLGVFMLLWEGELIAVFAHRRLREKPPSGGVSVLRESIALPVSMRDRCTALLRSFGWQGPAMIEFKGESLEGEPVLMEVNARFWGSLQLAIDAGVDFPRLLVEAASGSAVQPLFDYQVGVRSRWFWGDVDHLWARLRYSRDELNLTLDAPSRGRVLLDFLRAFGPSTRSEVFRWDDPGPALVETREWLRGQ